MAAELAYRIVVVGELGGWLGAYLEHATIDAAGGTTTITGWLRDPNALQVVMRALVDLGLQVESAELL